jgi:hypothetical protein
MGKLYIDIDGFIEIKNHDYPDLLCKIAFTPSGWFTS